MKIKEAGRVLRLLKKARKVILELSDDDSTILPVCCSTEVCEAHKVVNEIERTLEKKKFIRHMKRK